MPSTQSKPTPAHSWRFDAIGTKWEIATEVAVSETLRARIGAVIEEFDATYSRFRADSLIRKMAEAPGEYTLPKNSEIIFDFYDALWEITDHQVTPLVGDALADAGYDETYSLKPKETHPVFDFKEAIHRTGSKFEVKQKTLIDIGAAGKGFLVDEITKLLKGEGFDSFVVDGSGDMSVAGKTEVVGLENPFDTTQVIGAVEVTDRALCASATNRRAWGEWHHIINPLTGKPVKDIVATWVIADSAMVADGLATSLFFTSPQKLAEQYNYEYMKVHADGSVEYSDYFSKGVFK